MKKFIILIASALIAFSSCLKDSGFYISNNRTYGNVYKEWFISDEGYIYNISNAEKFPEIKTNHRSYVTCNISGLNQDGATVELVSVDESEILERASFTEPDPEFEPTDIQQVWLSGGYLNVIFNHYAESDTLDLSINIGQIDSLTTGSVMACELRVKSHLHEVRPYSKTSFTQTSLVSVPVYDYFEERPYAYLYFYWRNYTEAVVGTTKTKYYSVSGQWTAGSFVQPELVEALKKE